MIYQSYKLRQKKAQRYPQKESQLRFIGFRYCTIEKTTGQISKFPNKQLTTTFNIVGKI